MITLDGFAITFPRFRFHPLHCTIAAGDRIALLGANGAGKSTLMRALAGLLAGYEGSILIDSTELRARLPRHRQRVGFLPERVLGTPDLTVGERLDFLAAFHPEWDTAYADALLAELELDRDARVGTLSKGMALKFSFVAAEAHRPWLLLLDEPTSGLDPVIRRRFLALLRRSLEIAPHRTLMFSTHILEDVEEFAERIWVLSDGRMTTDSPLSELRARGNEGPLSSELLNAIDQPQAP